MPNRKKVIIAAAAAFTIGAAFAAQPVSVRADRDHPRSRDRDLWMPGADMVMSAHEPDDVPLAPPR